MSNLHNMNLDRRLHQNYPLKIPEYFDQFMFLFMFDSISYKNELGSKVIVPEIVYVFSLVLELILTL